MNKRKIDASIYSEYKVDPNEDLWAVLSLEVMNAAVTAELMAFHYSTKTPQPGSRAEALVAEEPFYSAEGLGPINVQEALRNVALIVMSGNDHLMAIGRILDPRPMFGPSVGTTTRGAVEAYAKAHYLMDAPDTKTFMAKYLASRRSSLKWPARTKKDSNKEPIHTPGSRAAQNMIDRVNAAAAAWGIAVGDISPQGFADTVEQLLEEFLDEEQPEELHTLYADLSAVAHAELSGLRFFMSRPRNYDDTGIGQVFVGPQPPYVNHMIQVALRAQMVVMFEFIELHSIPAEDQEDWIDAVQKVIFWTDHIGAKSLDGA